ncbi:hypothetical protein LSAT2_014161, partial [Lamellibrachia satsuma]
SQPRENVGEYPVLPRIIRVTGVARQNRPCQKLIPTDSNRFQTRHLCTQYNPCHVVLQTKPTSLHHTLIRNIRKVNIKMTGATEQLQIAILAAMKSNQIPGPSPNHEIIILIETKVIHICETKRLIRRVKTVTFVTVSATH